MPTTIVGKQNDLTSSWNVSTVAGILVGTLVISNNIYFDMGLTDIVRIEDTTASAVFGINATTTFSNGFTNGLPTYTWVISGLPAGVASGDTLLIYINVTPDQLTNLLLQYQKA